METEIITLIAGFVMSLITQVTKKYFAGINPQVVVAIFACIMGGVYCLIGEFYDVKVIGVFVVKAFSTAVVIYSVAKQFAKVKK